MSQLAKVECVLCERDFSLDDVYRYNFFLANGVCYDCLKKLFRQPTNQSCFGKQYDALALECKKLCPDRQVCPLFQFGDIKKLRRDAASLPTKVKAPDRNHPFKTGSAIRKIFDFCQAGCSRKELHKLTIRLNVNLTWAIGVLRREKLYDHAWRWKQKGDRYQVVFPKE